ncbi:MAG: DUF3164 family protein [Methylomarinum sp.]|nr:DUF3164 family protein [Methylomarinum sp.]
MVIKPPAGYMKNAQGHLVPDDSIEDIDKLRNSLVTDVIKAAKLLQSDMARFKATVVGDIDAFVEISAEEYDTKLGGKKGNLSLTSFDGQYKILMAVSDTLAFDERIQIAKQLIDECIHEWTKNSDNNVKALIEHAFQTDKEGNINTGRVLGLFKLKIEDEKWQKAMEALKDSISVASSKRYMRIYERPGNDEKYQQISLDISRL